LRLAADCGLIFEHGTLAARIGWTLDGVFQDPAAIGGPVSSDGDVLIGRESAFGNGLANRSNSRTA